MDAGPVIAVCRHWGAWRRCAAVCVHSRTARACGEPSRRRLSSVCLRPGRPANRAARERDGRQTWDNGWRPQRRGTQAPASAGRDRDRAGCEAPGTQRPGCPRQLLLLLPRRPPAAHQSISAGCAARKWRRLGRESKEKMEGGGASDSQRAGWHDTLSLTCAGNCTN